MSLKHPAVAVVLALTMLVPAFLTAPVSAAGSYDARVSAADCDLLGRAYAKGLGCSRTTCVSGAKRYRKVYGAEACRLRTETEFGFVSTIESRRCQALGRRWIAAVNYCASYPDRSADAVYNAPQCEGARSVYVPLSETDGYYDECLTPARVRELVLLGRLEGKSLTQEASERSSVQCRWRPESAFVAGRCVAGRGSRPARGGTVMVGDSLTWRGTDELTKRRPTFFVDGEPARQLSALPGRLAAYSDLAGAPTGVVIALGTVPSPAGFDKSDLARVVRSLPRSARLMFVLPYAELTPGRPTPHSTKVAAWMRAIGTSRSRSCLADWPAYVRSHRGVLQDGVHVTRAAEKQWARFVDKAWSRC
jgi:hypothetical protein